MQHLSTIVLCIDDIAFIHDWHWCHGSDTTDQNQAPRTALRTVNSQVEAAAAVSLIDLAVAIPRFPQVIDDRVSHKEHTDLHWTRHMATAPFRSVHALAAMNALGT